ncbi:stage II sporulation protein R [Bacillus sp. PS06]|uniref:stage II sporulation protein R n=1 Tax=Bacillus sp. PS06 TaxID=2764176 RepID=UPI001780FE64|nr:stage II sporulation protein R [Bacillus sp. PS06]MBD8069523.1 stage II sporulation protein R [Bacillus sp. PS06]
MKKQTMIIIYIVLMLIGANAGLLASEPAAQGQDPLVIPDEAIRLRILANSDSDKDQELKRKIRDEVNKEITLWVQELTSIDDARAEIKNRLDEIEVIVEEVLKRENSMQDYKVEFGNVDFPTKLYGKFLYPAGQYEAILITLGEGNGANWWCVLFPPLCFLDFSNGEAVDASEAELETEEEPVEEVKEKEEPEVKFFIVEFFTSLFS